MALSLQSGHSEIVILPDIAIVHTAARLVIQMIKLKNCPFCGGKAELFHGSEGWYNTTSYVKCSLCGTATKEFPMSVEYTSNEKAAEAWNKRIGDTDDNND